VQVCIGEAIDVVDYAQGSSKSAAQKLTTDLEAKLNLVDQTNAPVWALKPT
jgi:hypothetical protein